MAMRWKPHLNITLIPNNFVVYEFHLSFPYRIKFDFFCPKNLFYNYYKDTFSESSFQFFIFYINQEKERQSLKGIIVLRFKLIGRLSMTCVLLVFKEFLEMILQSKKLWLQKCKRLVIRRKKIKFPSKSKFHPIIS